MIVNLLEREVICEETRKPRSSFCIRKSFTKGLLMWRPWSKKRGIRIKLFHLPKLYSSSNGAKMPNRFPFSDKNYNFTNFADVMASPFATSKSTPESSAILAQTRTNMSKCTTHVHHNSAKIRVEPRRKSCHLGFSRAQPDPSGRRRPTRGPLPPTLNFQGQICRPQIRMFESRKNPRPENPSWWPRKMQL